MSNQDSIDRVKLRIDREQFRACISFYSATVFAAISALVTLIGAGEILAGNPQGNEMILRGLTASVFFIQVMRSASDRVKKISD